MDKRPELLAPAGEWDSFVAAVRNGADAVYMGGALFNARQYAGNFDDDSLRRALEYAHVRGIKVYMAMNTLIADDEMAAAVDQAGRAYNMGIDGIIVQDIGFAALVRRFFPELSLHASTQMTIHSAGGASFLEERGFKRVVLARELSLDEIGELVGKTGLETEVFVHGALCISYSGQCLMSSLIGGRSGNRGRCAQPCRLPYSLMRPGGVKAAEGYLLSPRDLCCADILSRLVKAGVGSLKIEGRMKSPEYVANVVRIYRKYLDAVMEGKTIAVSEEDMRALLLSFNRGGFSHGYLEGYAGKKIIAVEKPKNWGIFLGTAEGYEPGKKEVRVRLQETLSMGDGIEIWNGEEASPGAIVSSIKAAGSRVNTAAAGELAEIGYVAGRIRKGDRVYKTSDRLLNEAARQSLREDGPKVRVKGSFYAGEGLPSLLEVSDDEGNSMTIEGRIPEKALTKGLDRDRIASQLRRTGGTPFEFSSIVADIAEGLSMSAGSLNEMRRKGLEALEALRIEKYTRNISISDVEKELNRHYYPGNSRSGEREKKTQENIIYSIFVYNIHKAADYSQLGADRLCLPLGFFLRERSKPLIDRLKEAGTEVFCWLPPASGVNYRKLAASQMDGLVAKGVDGILAGNPGSIKDFENRAELLRGDLGLNVFNSISVKELSGVGLKGLTLSAELDLNRIERLRLNGATEIEAVVYGRLPLMTSRYCPAGWLNGCGDKGGGCPAAEAKGCFRLKDRKGAEFPVISDRIDCMSMIFNARVLFLPELHHRLADAGVKVFRFNMVEESAGEMEEILKIYRQAGQRGEAALREYADAVERIRSAGFTRGHYLRGV